MFGRLWRAEGQTRAARTVEYFGYVDFTLGLLLLLDPWLSVTLLHVPALTQQEENPPVSLVDFLARLPFAKTIGNGVREKIWICFALREATDCGNWF